MHHYELMSVAMTEWRHGRLSGDTNGIIRERTWWKDRYS